MRRQTSFSRWLLPPIAAAASVSGVFAAESRWALEPPTAARAVVEDRYPERRVSFPGGVASLADVVYSTVAGFRPLTLDLYLPPKTAEASAVSPVIIYVHGGGWTSGHTRHSGAFENWPEVLASIAARGYVVASVNYRLSGEASSPAAAHDVKSAIRWLRVHSSRYGVDTARIGIWGGSAGGQLAALAGTSCGVAALEPPAQEKSSTASSCVQSVVAWYGVFDFAPLVGKSAVDTPVARYLACPNAACSAEKIPLASASAHADATDPPFLLIHGALDRTVSVEQSKAFDAVLRAKGVRSELLILPDVDHSFVGSTAESTRQASLRALEATLVFFDATLQKRH
jgi:acetyl esterase/lipase